MYRRGKQGRTDDRCPRPVRVLFVCTGNSARSQIAEALLGRIGGDGFAVFSAGTGPKGVNPYTVRVSARKGSTGRPRAASRWGSFLGQPFDYVITVCDRARQTCPGLPRGAREAPLGSRGTRQRWMGPTTRRLGGLPGDLSRRRDRRIRPFVAGAVRSAGRGDQRLGLAAGRGRSSYGRCDRGLSHTAGLARA